MFSLGRRREEQALVSASSNGSPNKKKKPTMRQRLSSFKDSSVKKRLSGNVPAPSNPNPSPKKQVAISEDDGIEVSLESREPQGLERNTIEPVIDVQELIRLRRKIYKKKLSVYFPALQQHATNASTSTIRQHRIPLLGTKEKETSFLDALHLLQTSGPKDEHAAVSQELKSLSMELNALEKDKNALEQKQSVSTSTGSSSSSADWDINRMLTQASSKDDISMEERQKLQIKRGNNLTFHLSNNKAKQVLLSKFGAKAAASSKVVTIGPHNCKKPTTKDLQNLTLLNAHQNSKPGVIRTSFVISSDKAQTQTWGHLPLNLFRRIKYHDSFKTEHIKYLSSGPLGSYFVEFSSGESWWGSPIEDHEFFQLLQEWAVHRVVFGPAEALEDSRGNLILTHSWIIIAKDGKLAWKNLPSKLHNLLRNRQKGMAGLAEASLGPGNCFFCKFLDDTIEYCLPAHIAATCKKIEDKGGKITNVILHPEISKDYVIRHTGINGKLT